MVNATINTTLLFNGTSGPGALVDFANAASGGLFANVILATIFTIILLLVLRKSDFASAITISAFNTTIIAFLFLFANFISWHVAVFFLLITAIGLWVLWATK